MVDTITEARFTNVMLSRSSFMTALTLLAIGCTNGTEPGPSTPTEEGQPPTTTVENTGAGYTIALPQGSSTTPTEKAPGQYEYTTPGGTVLVTVKAGDQAMFDALKAQYTAKATSFGGRTNGSTTQVSSYWREASTVPRSSATALFANAKIYECAASSNSAPTHMICQSLKAL